MIGFKCALKWIGCARFLLVALNATNHYPFSSGELTPALGFIVFTRFYQMMIGLGEQVYDGNWFKTHLRCWLSVPKQRPVALITRGRRAEGNKWFLRG